VRLFHTREQEGFLFSPLLKCLERDDEYIMQKANKVITGIIWFAPPFLPLFSFFFFFFRPDTGSPPHHDSSGAPITNEDFKQYFEWLVARLRSTSPVQLETAIQALMNLLLVIKSRTPS